MWRGLFLQRILRGIGFSPPSNTSMDQQHPVLARLLSANVQWSKDVEQAEPGFFTKLAAGQTPKVLWITCADSRVPESVITASRPGDIFVHRNIANQFHPDDSSANSVLQYAIEFLGVEHVIIVGHTQCGGAAATYAAATSAGRTACSAIPVAVPSHPASDPINVWLAPLTRLACSLDISHLSNADALTHIVEENVKEQVTNVTRSTIMLEAWKSGKKVWVHGWVFEIEHGRLRDLHVSRSQ